MQCRRKPYDYSKPRPNYPRTRSGCLSCRHRKKKCDEAKPTCQACRRNHLECHWPDIPRENSAGPSSSGGSKSRSPNSVLPQPNAEQDKAQSPSSPSISSISSRSSASSKSSFISRSQSPTRDLSRSGTACMLTQSSVGLLRHYLEYTAGLLTTAPLTKCPFITIILPLAYSDDLLMHTVLALSGTHLECRQYRWSAGAIGGAGSEIQRATTLHYHNMISGLRQELTDFDSADSEKQLRILLILTMLYHYEAISGNTTDMIFRHLHASGEIIWRLLAQPQDSIDQTTLGFCLELYAYTTALNSFSSHWNPGAFGQSHDAFINSLDGLSRYATFGSIFGGCHSLYALIPQISQLSAECLAEESISQSQWVPSQKLRSTYQRIEQRIATWALVPPGGAMERRETDVIATAAELVRHALYLYLIASFCGPRRPDVNTREKIQLHLDVFMGLMPLVHEARDKTILLWPTVIVGSCMIDETQQQGIMDALLNAGFDMKHLYEFCDLLKLMWSDDGENTYGPYGLYKTMERNSKCIPFM